MKKTLSNKCFIDIIEMCFHKKENLWYNNMQKKVIVWIKLL